MKNLIKVIQSLNNTCLQSFSEIIKRNVFEKIIFDNEKKGIEFENPDSDSDIETESDSEGKL